MPSDLGHALKPTRGPVAAVQDADVDHQCPEFGMLDLAETWLVDVEPFVNRPRFYRR